MITKFNKTEKRGKNGKILIKTNKVIRGNHETFNLQYKGKKISERIFNITLINCVVCNYSFLWKWRKGSLCSEFYRIKVMRRELNTIKRCVE